MEIWWMINKQSHFQTVKKNNINANRTTTKKMKKKKTNTNQQNQRKFVEINELFEPSERNLEWSPYAERYYLTFDMQEIYANFVQFAFWLYVFRTRNSIWFFLLIFFAHFFPNLMRFFFQIWIKFAKWSKNVRIFFSANLLSLSK